MYYISNQTNVHVTLDGKKNGVKKGCLYSNYLLALLQNLIFNGCNTVSAIIIYLPQTVQNS